MMNATPKKVEPFSPHELFLSWSDGRDFSVPYTEIRYFCPCASCVDEHTGKRVIQRSSVNPDIRPMEVHPVGRYALQFNWSDGHTTGIYHYDTLYSICTSQGRKLN